MFEKFTFQPSFTSLRGQSVTFMPDDAYINGLVQERRNSIANALELRLSNTSLLKDVTPVR